MLQRDLIAALDRMAKDREAPFLMPPTFDRRNEAYTLREAIKALMPEKSATPATGGKDNG